MNPRPISATPGDEEGVLDAFRATRRRDVRRAFLWRFGEGVGLEFSSFVFFMALSRLLMPGAFGIVSVAGTIIHGFRVMLIGGFGPALLQKAELDPEHFTAAFWANFAMGAAGALAVTALAWPLSITQGKAELLPLLVALSPMPMVTSATWIYQANLKRHLRYDITALSSLASIGVGGTVGVALAYVGAGAWSLVGQQLSGAATGLVILVLCSSWHPGASVSGRHLRELAWFAGKSGASGILEFLGGRVDALILGFFLSAYTIGIYFVAARVPGMVMGTMLWVCYDLVIAVLPRFSQGTPAFREAAYRGLQFSLLLGFSAFIGMAVVAGNMVPLLLGPAWNGAVQPLQILCLSSIAYTFVLIGRQILNAAGCAGISLVITAINAGLYVVVMLIAAPRGLIAAAAAGGIASCLCVPIVVVALRWKLGLHIRRMLSDQVPIWGATLLMAGSVSLLGQAIPAGTNSTGLLAALLAKVAVGVVVFAGAVWLLAPEEIGRASCRERV